MVNECTCVHVVSYRWGNVTWSFLVFEFKCFVFVRLFVCLSVIQLVGRSVGIVTSAKSFRPHMWHVTCDNTRTHKHMHSTLNFIRLYPNCVRITTDLCSTFVFFLFFSSSFSIHFVLLRFTVINPNHTHDSFYFHIKWKILHTSTFVVTIPKPKHNAVFWQCSDFLSCFFLAVSASSLFSLSRLCHKIHFVLGHLKKTLSFHSSSFSHSHKAISVLLPFHNHHQFFQN